MQIQIQVWDVSQAETIIRFNRKCFLTDLFIYNWQGEQDYIKIMNLGVHPDYRGQGLAHRLLTHAAREMTALGMKRFCGETRASNQAMRKVFEACGYRLERTEAGYYADPEESACKYVLRLE